MKKVCSFLLVVTLIFNFIPSAFALEHWVYFDSEEEMENTTVKFSINKDGISSERITVDESVDNSNLMVKVIQPIGNGETREVYRGPMSGLKEGAWQHVDYSKIWGFAVLIKNPDSLDVLYIIPLNEEETNEIQSSKAESTSKNMQLYSDNIVTPDVSVNTSYYINDTQITEGLSSVDFTANDYLSVNYSVTNNGTLAQNVTMILTLYDEEGMMIGTSCVSDIINASETATLQDTISVPSNIENCYAKVMLWDSLHGLRPLYPSVQIGSIDAEQVISSACIECLANKEYNLVITAENIPQNDKGTYTVRYDAAKLSLVDACSLTYKNELMAENIEDLNINIISVDAQNGTIVFSNINDSDSTISKVLNSIKFKSLVSDTSSTITIE